MSDITTVLLPKAAILRPSRSLGEARRS